MASVTRNPLKLLQVCFSDIHVAAAWAQKKCVSLHVLSCFLSAPVVTSTSVVKQKPSLATSGSQLSVCRGLVMMEDSTSESEPEITGMHGNARAATHVAPVVAPAYSHNTSWA